MAKHDYTPEELEKKLQGVDTKADEGEDPEVDVDHIVDGDDDDDEAPIPAKSSMPTLEADTPKPQHRRRRFFDDDEEDDEDEVYDELSRIARDEKDERNGLSKNGYSDWEDGDISNDDALDLLGDDEEDGFIDSSDDF